MRHTSCTSGSAESLVIKPEDAVLIFGKWKDEALPVQVVARLASGYFSLERCFVRNCDSEAVGLDLPDGSAAEFSIAGCDFEYGEPAEGEEEDGVRVIVAMRPVPGSERIFFMNWRDSSRHDHLEPEH